MKGRANFTLVITRRDKYKQLAFHVTNSLLSYLLFSNGDFNNLPRCTIYSFVNNHISTEIGRIPRSVI